MRMKANLNDVELGMIVGALQAGWSQYSTNF